jgi:hypothetical protein
MPRQAGSCLSCQTLGSAGMLSRISMNVQRALSGRLLNACTSKAAAATEGRATPQQFGSASARAVRPLAASAQPKWFDTASARSTEPALSTVDGICLPGHSFLGRERNPKAIQVPVSCRQLSASSERMQALRRSEKQKTRGGAVRTALPNPSIEGDVQGLAPLSAPHVKRWASQ